MDVLSIRGLTKHYPSFTLDGVSFSVQKGEIMGFIGRNGAGKTTTLKSLLNFVHPDAGEIRFFGLPFAANELAIKRRIGFVSGGVDYYQRSTLHTIKSVTSAFYPGWDKAAYNACLERFALNERKTVSQLSAGMKVKFGLALALSHHAELLILDEPTSGLDPVSRDDLLDVFLSLAREGTSILFSTHITSDLDKCADRITYIRSGQILASEGMDAFVGKYRALAFADAPQDPAVLARLIGLKPAKHGYTAIALAQDVDALALGGTPCDLETIMIHVEKE